MATLVTAALPDDVAIDRLVLVAPAISPDYPLADRSLAARARVRRQLRERARSASRLGHAHVRHDRPQEHRRAPARSASPPRTSACSSTTGRRPTRRSATPAITLLILSGRWQAAKLLPALDPSVDPEALRARWAQTCKESDMTVVILALLGGVVGGALLSDFGGFVLGARRRRARGLGRRSRGPRAHARAAARGPESGRRAGTGRRSAAGAASREPVAAAAHRRRAVAARAARWRALPCRPTPRAASADEAAHRRLRRAAPAAPAPRESRRRRAALDDSSRRRSTRCSRRPGAGSRRATCP